jgi:alpha-amylase
MPGTPCIFLTHWRDCKQSIKAMIDVRRAAGIQNTSTYTGVVTNQQQYAAYSSDGSKSKLLVVVGQTGLYTPADSWVKVLSGHHFAYYLDKGANTAWVDLASGKFEGKQQATLTAVTATAGAQLVYTTDGSTPTASSTKVASGTKIDIEEAMTLKVGLLIGSTVSGIVTRNYTFADPSEKRTINIYVNTDKVGWNAVNFWSWGGDDSHAPAKGEWPGDKITTTTTIDGMQWFSKSFTINNDEDFVNFVFSTGSGSPQTVDVENVSTTKYFEISDQKSGTKHLVNDVTDQHTAGISDLKSDPRQPTGKIYNLGGQQVNRIGQRGIYIVNGKKIVVK